MNIADEILKKTKAIPLAEGEVVTINKTSAIGGTEVYKPKVDKVRVSQRIDNFWETLLSS